MCCPSRIWYIGAAFIGDARLKQAHAMYFQTKPEGKTLLVGMLPEKGAKTQHGVTCLKKCNGNNATPTGLGGFACMFAATIVSPPAKFLAFWVHKKHLHFY
jgi:hypothetical protein